LAFPPARFWAFFKLSSYTSHRATTSTSGFFWNCSITLWPRTPGPITPSRMRSLAPKTLLQEPAVATATPIAPAFRADCLINSRRELPFLVVDLETVIVLPSRFLTQSMFWLILRSAQRKYKSWIRRQSLDHG